MDILERAFLMVQAELGPEIFNDEARLRLSLRLRREEGGDRHYIASTDALECQQRHAAVFKAFQEGVLTRAIAERTGITQRRVNQILASTPIPYIQSKET